jgi:glyoxylase-like metal-dependent hydrolase (beta-lactamase superfamily II)
MKQVVPGVFTFVGLMVGRAFLIVDPEGLTVVDTGLSRAAPKILAQLRAAGYQPEDVKRILITHAHPDHIGGLIALKEATGAEVITSTVEGPILKGQQPMPGPLAEDLSQVSRLMRAGRAQEELMEPHPVDRVIADGEVLPEVMGGLQAVFTPGHTPGHVAFWQPERRVLFCGDAIMRMVGLSLPFAAFTSDMAQNRRSVGRIAALEPSVVCFGHGEPLTDHAASVIGQFARKVGVSEG